MKKYVLMLLVISCTTPPVDQEGWVEASGTKLYYHMMGKGEPIVIVHGGPVLDQSYLVDHFKSLAKDYLLVFFDQRACGKSEANVDPTSMSMKTMAEDIEAFRKSLSLEKIHLLGHSWGGLLAIQYAYTYPENIRTLILSNPTPPTADLWKREEAEVAKRFNAYDSVLQSEITQSYEFRTQQVSAVNELMKISFKRQFSDTSQLVKLNINLPKDYFKRAEKFGYLGPELVAFDFTDELMAIQCPALVVYGDQEPAVAISGNVYRETMPHCTLTVIPSCGHFPFIEKADTYFEEVRTFLKKSKDG